MDSVIKDFIHSASADKLYIDFLKAIKDYDMSSMIKGGTLIGLSGGADSVALLLLLLKYREQVGDFPLLAVHVNHCIRGEEADRDEAFSRSLANSAGVEFSAVRLDCPRLRDECGGSLEEVARNARYSKFADIIASRNDISCIAVAHNADDNTETVLFNLMRGTGLSGVCGIPPIRDKIVRPMIFLKKKDIVFALNKAAIPFVIDSTNLDENYSRNYIRSKIVPNMLVFSNDLHSLISRASHNLRSDSEYLESVATEFIKSNEGKISCEALSRLHPAILARVIKHMARTAGSPYIEHTHIQKIMSLLNTNNFSYSLPGEFNFMAESGHCYIQHKVEKTEFYFDLKEEHTVISDFSAEVVISDRKNDEISSNVYNFSIQADISSAIISNGIFIRNKKDGDSYRYGGMTHKLKKLFNDSKIPPSLRDHIPVFCDQSGILWVPGFGIRDDASKDDKKMRVTLLVNTSGGKNFFYIPKK